MVIERTLVKFADDFQLGRTVNMLEGRAAVQRDPGRLEEGANGNLMKYNKNCTWKGRIPGTDTCWGLMDWHSSTKVFSYKDTILADMGRWMLALISPFVFCWSYPPKLYYCREWYNCHQPLCSSEWHKEQHFLKFIAKSTETNKATYLGSFTILMSFYICVCLHMQQHRYILNHF